ncbi:1-phosphofructokinase [Halobacillus massiliensis]|uniref:1-phosphofructokinase n=1 Tax=Halobacillus massiliensis TaxID=1926286 RepID=UPI0009E4FA0F|nr:1-phosphofructokinase [Halobacillus massiliensis]
MIYTCTLNPSIDYIMHLDQLKSGSLNRSTQTMYYPGGKGINVSRVMKRFGTSNTALGFVGHFTGQFITSYLENEGIQQDFIQIDDFTRINVKLKADEETEINGPGPKISEEPFNQLIQQVRSLSADDYLILAGSVPSSLPEDFYFQIAELCKKNNVHLAADTSGDALKQIAGSPLFFMKPNDHELGELFNTKIETKEQAAHYGQKLAEQGAEHVIVSMGGRGAVYVSKDQKLFATVPKGEVKNSVGAGDSVVAGFISAIEKGAPVEEAFRQGVASGSATAFQDDLCSKEEADQLLSEISISPIN